jgi:hypothetical protein
VGALKLSDVIGYCLGSAFIGFMLCWFSWGFGVWDGIARGKSWATEMRRQGTWVKLYGDDDRWVMTYPAPFKVDEEVGTYR